MDARLFFIGHFNGGYGHFTLLLDKIMRLQRNKYEVPILLDKILNILEHFFRILDHFSDILDVFLNILELFISSE